MTKIITTTFLLRHPAKVREMVQKGMTLLVKFEGKVVMEISLPSQKKNKLPPTFNSNLPNYTFNREELYDRTY
jgi:hypothetical protein